MAHLSRSPIYFFGKTVDFLANLSPRAAGRQQAVVHHSWWPTVTWDQSWPVTDKSPAVPEITLVDRHKTRAHINFIQPLDLEMGLHTGLALWDDNSRYRNEQVGDTLIHWEGRRVCVTTVLSLCMPNQIEIKILVDGTGRTHHKSMAGRLRSTERKRIDEGTIVKSGIFIVAYAKNNKHRQSVSNFRNRNVAHACFKVCTVEIGSFSGTYVLPDRARLYIALTPLFYMSLHFEKTLCCTKIIKASHITFANSRTRSSCSWCLELEE